MLKHYKDSLQKNPKNFKVKATNLSTTKKFTQTFLQIQWALLNVITVNVIIRLMLSLLQLLSISLKNSLIAINFLIFYQYFKEFETKLNVFLLFLNK